MYIYIYIDIIVYYMLLFFIKFVLGRRYLYWNTFVCEKIYLFLQEFLVPPNFLQEFHCGRSLVWWTFALGVVAMRPSTTADAPRRDEGHGSASEHLQARQCLRWCTRRLFASSADIGVNACRVTSMH